MTATVTSLAERRAAAAQAPRIIELTMVEHPDGRLRGFTSGVDLSCPASRLAAAEALRAIARHIEEIS